MNELSKKIIDYRAKNNLSMEKFADLCKISTQTVWSIENGQQKPSRLTLAKIEGVLENDGIEHKQD